MQNKYGINNFIRRVFQNIDASGYTYDLDTHMIQGYHLFTRENSTKAHPESDSVFCNKDYRQAFNPLNNSNSKHSQSPKISVHSNLATIKNNSNRMTYLHQLKPIYDQSCYESLFNSNPQSAFKKLTESDLMQRECILKETKEIKQQKFNENEKFLAQKMPSTSQLKNVKIKKLSIRPTLEENKIRLGLKVKKLKQTASPHPIVFGFDKNLNKTKEILTGSIANEIIKVEKPNKEKSYLGMDASTINTNYSIKNRTKMHETEEMAKSVKKFNYKSLQRERSEILIDLIANENLIKKCQYYEHPRPSDIRNNKTYDSNFNQSHLNQYYKDCGNKTTHNFDKKPPSTKTINKKTPIYENINYNINQNVYNKYRQNQSCSIEHTMKNDIQKQFEISENFYRNFNSLYRM
jgi:hypothetical protein